LVITNGYDEQFGLRLADDLYSNHPGQSVLW